MAKRTEKREGALWPALREYWHPVAFADELKDDKPLAVTLLDERLAICRLGGKPRAFYDLCVHRGTPISLGWVEGESVVCAYHGWAYDSGGQCTRIPSVPDGHPIPKKACLTSFLCEEKYGIIWVCMSEKPKTPIADYPEFDDGDYDVFVKDKDTWDCSSARAIENFVDQAHFPWVHEGILGDREHTVTPEIELERDGEALLIRRQDLPTKFHPVPHVRNYRLTRPFTIYQRKEEDNGNAECFYFVVTPHSAKKTTWYFLIARNFDPEAMGVQGEEHFYRTILEQDLVILKEQRPEELPLDLSEELHIKGPDAVALAYRRLLAELDVE
jgi:phenylpropionate dioxygenase-like ring-hydroxylating dioxygenase large terminal subunit